MRLWAITIGGGDPGPVVAALTAAGGAADGTQLPSDPSRVELDAALDAADGRRIVVHAATADLGRVLRRLSRRGELDSVETAVLPLESSPFLARFGITSDLATSARIAVSGVVRTVGIIRDDSGHLLVDSAVLTPWSGRRVWVRAYVDDDRLCDGEIASLSVARGTAGGVTATVVRSRFSRPRTLSGRGLALACDDAAISTDGAVREQPRRKRIWWDEPTQWHLAVGPAHHDSISK